MDSIYDRKQKQSFDYKISGEGMNGAISTVFSFFKNSGISSAFLGLYLGKTLHIHEWWKEAGTLCRARSRYSPRELEDPTSAGMAFHLCISSDTLGS